jgi:hypothetical protein
MSEGHNHFVREVCIFVYLVTLPMPESSVFVLWQIAHVCATAGCEPMFRVVKAATHICTSHERGRCANNRCLGVNTVRYLHKLDERGHYQTDKDT